MDSVPHAEQPRAVKVKVFPVRVTPGVIVGAVAWTLSIVFFIVQGVVQAASARPFSLSTRLISDLGNTACGPAVCSPLHDLMNATFIAVGILHFAGTAATWSTWPAGIRSRVGLILLALAGWGLTSAGVFPENMAPDQHRIGALIGLIGLNVSMLLLGSVLFEVARSVGILSVAAGVIGSAALVSFLSQAPGLPIGIYERLADYPGAVMVIVIGGLILFRGIKILARDSPSQLC